MSLVSLTSLTALLALSVASYAASLDYWVTSPLHNVFKDTSAPINRKTSIRLVAVRNQMENAQVVLVPAQDVKSAHIEFEPLMSKSGHRIGPDGFDFNFLEYYRVERNSTKTPPEMLLRLAPDDFPDAFLEERVLDLTPGRNWPVFLSFMVPRNAEPGIYSGKLWIAGKGIRIPVDVSLEVLPVTLPDDTRLAVTLWFDGSAGVKDTNIQPWSEDYWDALKNLGKMMRAHHQNIAWASPTYIKCFKETDGRITYDYSLLDKWVETFDSLGINRLIEITHIAGRPAGTWEENFAVSSFTAEDRATGQKVEISMDEWAGALQKHMEEKGWVDRTAVHIADEPIDTNWQSWVEISKRFHAAAPKLKRIDAILTPKVLNDIDIAVPMLDHFDYFPKEYRDFAAREGNQLWYYTAWVPQDGYPNRLMDYAAIKTRLLHWANYRYQAPGYLHWALFQWHVPFLTFAPGDNWIVWPGTRGPRSSIRYEAVRSGIEDYEFMAMLEDAHARVADKLNARIDPRERSLEFCTAIFRSGKDYDISPAKLESTRENLLHELACVEQSPLILVSTNPAEGTKADKITVKGVVEKGTAVKINGQPAKVDSTGSFTAETTRKRLTITAEKEGKRKTIVRLFR